MIKEYQEHFGRIARIYLKDKSEIEAIILDEKKGQLEIKTLKQSKESINTLDTQMIKGIYSEPLILIKK